MNFIAQWALREEEWAGACNPYTNTHTNSVALVVVVETIVYIYGHIWSFYLPSRGQIAQAKKNANTMPDRNSVVRMESSISVSIGIF